MRFAKVNKKHCRLSVVSYKLYVKLKETEGGGAENINKDAAVSVFKFA